MGFRDEVRDRIKSTKAASLADEELDTVMLATLFALEGRLLRTDPEMVEAIEEVGGS